MKNQPKQRKLTSFEFDNDVRATLDAVVARVRTVANPTVKIKELLEQAVWLLAHHYGVGAVAAPDEEHRGDDVGTVLARRIALQETALRACVRPGWARAEAQKETA